MHMQITVRAIPAPGHEYRRRAGRAWGKTPVVVTVTDTPDAAAKDPIQISPADFAMLKDDPLIAVAPVGGADPQNLDLRAQLAKAEADLHAARRVLSEMQEQIDRDGQERVAASEKNAADLHAAREQIDALRAQLAKPAKAARA